MKKTIKEQLEILKDRAYYLWEIDIYSHEKGFIALTDCERSDDIFKTIYECEYANQTCIDWHYSYCEDGTILILTIE